MAATSSWCRVPSYNRDFLSVQLTRKRKKSHEARALCEKAVLWIRFGFNADTDPSFLVNADPDANPDPDSDPNPGPGF
jgi:hypothetical protein